MLDLRPCHKALDRFHRSFIDEAVAPGVDREAFKRFDRKTYSRQELQWGVAAWQLRTLDEYRSQIAFTLLLAELAELGFAFDVLGTATRVVRDEVRHVELCRRLVKAFGGSDAIPGQPAYALPDRSVAPIRRVLRTVVGDFCIGETISVRLIAAVRPNAVDPVAHAVMTCLVADESIHSRFGWAMLELLWPHTSAEDRADVTAHLPRWLGGAESVVVRVPGGGAEPIEAITTAPMSPFGALDARERARVFYDAIERDVIARFEALGIAGRSAFDRRPRSHV